MNTQIEMYETPVVEVLHVEVESGFATSKEFDKPMFGSPDWKNPGDVNEFNW